MLPALEAALGELPSDQPRYLMGVGDPASIVEAVALGVDMFDCVLPTRLGRHGTLLTDDGRLNIKRSEFAGSDEPIDAHCGCEVCRTYSRGYLRHLMNVAEPAGPTLATLHNLAWLLGLVDRIREAIGLGAFAQLRESILAVYD
jgi:queuine tRNA-ribosyltransferase